MKKLLVTTSIALALIGCGSPEKPDVGSTSAVTATPDVVDMTLSEISHQLESGAFSSVELVQAYLERIEAIDKTGPTLNAVISVNPSALGLAEKSDLRRKLGQALSPIDGVPVLLKDNIESKDDLATTAGSTALINNVTGRDSPLVAALA